MADNRQMIIDLDKKRMTAMAQKDVATLNALIADDLVYTHSTARLDTKQSLIGNMESGATVYTAVEPSDVKAQDLGDAVVLTGSCRISVMSGFPTSRLRPITTAWVPANYPGVKDNKATAASRGKQLDVWAIEQSIDRGYAVATFYNGDIDPDQRDERGGIRPYLSSAKGRLASQSDRMRAAARSRRILSRATAYSSSAARSAAPTRPWVGETQAVGQRVMPLVRIYSATAALLSSSAKTLPAPIGIS